MEGNEHKSNSHHAHTVITAGLASVLREMNRLCVLLFTPPARGTLRDRKNYVDNQVSGQEAGVPRNAERDF